MSTETPAIARKKSKVPHTYVILFAIVLLAAIGTYLIPPVCTIEPRMNGLDALWSIPPHITGWSGRRFRRLIS